MIPNIVTKFQNVDIFYQICYILVLSFAHARRIVNIKSNICDSYQNVREKGLFANFKGELIIRKC